MNQLFDWFDDRTGYRALRDDALYEKIPGGARWRYVWGSTLVFTFMVQVVTGLFLWMCYSPSSRSAWESVYYIQYEMMGGWLLRGIHHYAAQAMVILLVLHLAQVVIDGAYKAPREVNFWIGLLLMQIVLGLALTGYLLPWDQKGYWATNVATNLMVLLPGVGSELQKLVVGGSSYGHATLTRFFALHAGVLPGMLILLLVMHLAVFRRHGIKAVGADQRPAQFFWPDQMFKDAVACLVVTAAILFFVLKGALFESHESEPIFAHLGAELGAPADPSVPYSAARPEWYFLFLFQLLKVFHGAAEIVGAIIIPGVVIGVLFLMPLVARWKHGHKFNVGFLAALGFFVAALTYLAVREDQKDTEFVKAAQIAQEDRMRAVQLVRAGKGIPVEGAMWLLRNDPKTQGPILFQRHCASCHTHQPSSGGNDLNRHEIGNEDPSAPDLWQFGRRQSISGFLDPEKIGDSSRVFGKTVHKDGEMASYVQSSLADPDEWSQEQINQVITALVAEAGVEPHDPGDEKSQAMIEAGRELIRDENRCAQCHKFHDVDPEAGAPDLTGYRSRQWTIDFIANPSHERFYGDNNDRMPSYVANEENPASNILSQQELELVVDWLRGAW